MIRTHQIACSLAKAEADALNRISGEVYTRTLVWHYRIYRRTGHWLSQAAGSRLEDYLGGPVALHAHTRDAAQQGFYAACEVARTQRALGLDVRYPHQRKSYRTTTWKNTGMRVRTGAVYLSRGRGLAPIVVSLPEHLRVLPARAFRQVELVWDMAAGHYTWHLSIEEEAAIPAAEGGGVVAVDLGEIHPAALSDGTEAAVVSCRELRSVRQYTAKRLAEIASKQANKKQGSRRWRRLQRRRNRFQGKQQRRTRDLEHKPAGQSSPGLPSTRPAPSP
jgi:putative transposase